MQLTKIILSLTNIFFAGLFPFLLQIVDPGSDKLKRILEDIEDPGKMFTPFGLRSISKQASMYMKKNTEHEAPYWWVSIERMILWKIGKIRGVCADWTTLVQFMNGLWLRY